MKSSMLPLALLSALTLGARAFAEDQGTLKILVIPTEHPVPIVVPPEVIHKRLVSRRDPHASRLDVAGLTTPILSIDQTRLHYKQRLARNNVDPLNPSRIEFSFEGGELVLRPRYEVQISSSLTPCAQEIWTEHEFDHVKNYEKLAGELVRRIQADPTVQSILRKGMWFPRSMFKLIQNTTHGAITGVYFKLTMESNRKRDTTATYRHIRRRVERTCGK